MNCMDFEKRIMDFVEGNLDSVLSKNMEAHIATCPECADMADAHRIIFESLNNSESVKAPAGLAERILSAVNADAPDNVIEFTPALDNAANPVDCGVFEDNIAAYTDGLTDDELLRHMDKHKAACTSCGSLANVHDFVLSSLNSAEPVKAPEGLAARILTAVEADAAQAKKSFGLVKLIKKYGVLTTAAAAAAGSLAAASVIILGGFADNLSSGGLLAEGMSALFAKIEAIPFLMHARIAGSIPAEYWHHINLLSRPVDIPYLGTSIPMFTIGAFLIVVAGTSIYFSMTKTIYDSAFSIDNPAY